MSGDENPGQAATIRKVGNQLFDVWEDRRGGRSKWQASAPAWVACILSLGAVLWQAAITSGDVEENRRRITAVEATQREQATDSRAMIERLARIEAKLDVLTEKK